MHVGKAHDIRHAAVTEQVAQEEVELRVRDARGGRSQAALERLLNVSRREPEVVVAGLAGAIAVLQAGALLAELPVAREPLHVYVRLSAIGCETRPQCTFAKQQVRSMM